MIQKLKENKVPFGLMSKEMQEKALEIGIKDNFRPYSNSADFTGYWGGCVGIDREFEESCTYQLRADYEPEQGVVKYKVKDIGGVFDYINDDGESMGHLCQAVDDCDFIGFLYEDEYVRPVSRCYRLSKGHDPDYRMYKNNIGKYEVLTPTHVLFKGKE